MITYTHGREREGQSALVHQGLQEVAEVPPVQARRIHVAQHALDLADGTPCGRQAAPRARTAHRGEERRARVGADLQQPRKLAVPPRR